jgi:hypothetical protein
MLDSPDVEFCGYSIPHPSETKMNLRIQTYGKLCAFVFQRRWLMTSRQRERLRRPREGTGGSHGHV